MRNFLTDQKRASLLKQHKKERDKRICDRIKAVLLYDEGWTYMQISKVLFLSDDAIRKHIKEFKISQKLSTENGGSTEKLSAEQSMKLIEHIESHTYLYTKDIVTYVSSTFDISYSISGLRYWLQRNGFSYKKPAMVPGKADKNAQEKWIKEYEDLKSNLEEDEAICFCDGVHPTHNTQVTYGWIKKGVRKEICSNTGRQRINLSGAIDLLGEKFHYQEDKMLNAHSTISFFENIANAYPEKKTVYIFVDNARYYKNKEVQKYLETSKIKLKHFPPYSPNLNPIERLWKLLKERILYNTYYSEYEDFRKAVFGFLESLKNLARGSELGKLIMRRVRDAFHPIGSLISVS